MITRATLVWIVLAASAIGALFAVKYEVQALEERHAAINRDVLDNLEAIHVLKAEWAYLNQPARLEDLGRRLLEMEPMVAEQSVTIADIPLRTGDEAKDEVKPDTPPAPVVRGPGASGPTVPVSTAVTGAAR